CNFGGRLVEVWLAVAFALLVDPARAQAVLFADGSAPSCDADVRCLVAARYGRWPPARAPALPLFAEMGDGAGREREPALAGGYRGAIHIVPALPVGDDLEHLRWVVAAQRDIEAFVVAVEGRAGRPVPYRHRALVWRFFRSVKKRTPSAYAENWE